MCSTVRPLYSPLLCRVTSAGQLLASCDITSTPHRWMAAFWSMLSSSSWKVFNWVSVSVDRLSSCCRAVFWSTGPCVMLWFNSSSSCFCSVCVKGDVGWLLSSRVSLFVSCAISWVLSPSLCLSDCLSFSLSSTFSFSLCLCPNLSLSLSLFVSRCVGLSIVLALSLSLCPSHSCFIYLYTSLSLSRLSSVSVCLSVCLPACLSVSFSLGCLVGLKCVVCWRWSGVIWFLSCNDRPRFNCTCT